ncbi:hypothetical protein ACS0X5_20720, partial [Burkholderia gladioli]|uniref:hypothetical protein n=1 Tax=Burkholderia gladioli TaxID=28095 RepID=UPI003F78CE3F
GEAGAEGGQGSEEAASLHDGIGQRGKRKPTRSAATIKNPRFMNRNARPIGRAAGRRGPGE